MAVAARERPLLVAGDWVETGEWQEVRSPYSGELVGRIAKAGADLARRAVDAADQAMREPLPAHRRAEILDRVAHLLAEREDEVAETICAEAGKPMKAARIEAQRAVSTYTVSAAVARTLAGEMIPMDASAAGAGKLGFTMRLPIGIVGAISPFNFPLNLVAHKIAPALAAGCAVVLKPASQTPMSALLLAELEHEAGLPAGWLNVLVGKASEIGDVLVEDERVRMITFTGSSGVGWDLRARAAQKKVTLELGNSTPVLVEADADVEDAAARLAQHAFSFAGQSCISVQRILVHEDVYDAFRDRLAEVAAALEPQPVISGESLDRMLASLDETRAAGATVVVGGSRLERPGWHLAATVVEGVAPDAPISRTELFGPVTALYPAFGLDEAIALVNDSPYGLTAAIHTASIHRALHFAERVQAGVVVVNAGTHGSEPHMGFGGVKDSGTGWREAGIESLDVYSDLKVVNLVVDPAKA